MKIRNGFVSNSSSSSFVVIAQDWEKAGANELPQEQVDLLLAEGWAPCLHKYPSRVEENGIEEPDKHRQELYLAYSVICNEDEVVEFLLKHKIPFQATTHYNHYFISYDPITDTIVRFVNFGMIYETYGDSFAAAVAMIHHRKEPILTFTPDEYLNR